MRLAFVVLFLSVGVSFLLCGVLERFISAPITGLTEVARSISEGGDYSLRASHSPRTDSDSGDEIDELYSAFNEMLEQVATVGRPDPDDAPELDTISHRQSDNLAPTKPHVLIIDDKPVNRKLLGWILENAGYTIECAECGQVGLEQSDAGFSLILVETQLQDMDACSFAEQLRLKGCEVPTIALISQSTAPNAYLDAGFSDCIAKPFRPEALLTCVARWAASDTPDEFSRSRSESWVVRRTFETPS